MPMNSRVRSSVTVHAPRRFVLASLEQRFLERTGDSAEPELRLRVELPPTFGGVAMDKSVPVTVSYVRENGAPKTIYIAWKPDDTTALPAFDGAFSAADINADECRLELAGTYTPPGGIAGWMFDRLAGRRIAKSTIASLLDRLATAAEADYRVRMTL